MSQSVQNCTSILALSVSVHNKKGFFRYINKRLGWCASSTISVQKDNTIVYGAAAAEVFRREFASNFTPRFGSSPQIQAIDDGFTHNCSIDDVIRTIRSSPSTAAGSDGYSYHMLKLLVTAIKDPLVIIFQHSLHDGKYPTL